MSLGNVTVGQDIGEGAGVLDALSSTSRDGMHFFRL